MLLPFLYVELNIYSINLMKPVFPVGKRFQTSVFFKMMWYNISGAIFISTTAVTNVSVLKRKRKQQEDTLVKSFYEFAFKKGFQMAPKLSKSDKYRINWTRNAARKAKTKISSLTGVSTGEVYIFGGGWDKFGKNYKNSDKFSSNPGVGEKYGTSTVTPIFYCVIWKSRSWVEKHFFLRNNIYLKIYAQLEVVKISKIVIFWK